MCQLGYVYAGSLAHRRRTHCWIERQAGSEELPTRTTACFYDAASQRVKTTRPDGTILYTPFPDYEVEDPPGGGANTVRTTHRLAGQIVAVQTRVGTAAGTFYYTYTDHLGNVVALSNATGGYLANSLARYDPFGNYRTEPTTNPGYTNHGYTGHRHNNTGTYATQDIGLIYMNARYYLPEVGRFISPDTIVPDPGNPQSYNRYSYSLNNPIRYSDPTGHMHDDGSRTGGGGSLENELTSAEETPRPEGELQTYVQSAQGCDPVFQSCEPYMDFWPAQLEIVSACNDGDCMSGHLWIYFGIPHTQEQRNSLIREETRRLCHTLGDCQNQEVGLMLQVIVFPIGRAGALVATAVDALLATDSGATTELAKVVAVHAAESGLDRAGMKLGSKIVSSVADLFSVRAYGNELASWRDTATDNVRQRVELQVSWLEYYEQNGR